MIKLKPYRELYTRLEKSFYWLFLVVVTLITIAGTILLMDKAIEILTMWFGGGIGQ